MYALWPVSICRYSAPVSNRGVSERVPMGMALHVPAASRGQNGSGRIPSPYKKASKANRRRGCSPRCLRWVGAAPILDMGTKAAVECRQLIRCGPQVCNGCRFVRYSKRSCLFWLPRLHWEPTRTDRSVQMVVWAPDAKRGAQTDESGSTRCSGPSKNQAVVQYWRHQGGGGEKS